jgi:hypothetical protein
VEKIQFDLENCYGIKKLSVELEFKHRVFAIYAPNGVMKTSFAKTMIDLSNGDKPKDLVFPERETKCAISLDGNDIKPEGILVVESYKDEDNFEKSSTLLANQDLKKEYDALHKEIDKARDTLSKNLRVLSGVKKDEVEQEISKVFGKDFFSVLLEKESDVLSGAPTSLKGIKYQSIFDAKVVEFLNTDTFKQDIQRYIQKYDELIEKSPYLNKSFKFHHAETVQKHLAENNFFQGGHSINISDGAQEKKYNDDQSLTTLFEEEKKKVFNDTELQNVFEGIGKKLSNDKLRGFRDYLLDNKEILPELSDLDSLKKKLWMDYLIQQTEAVSDLLQKYKVGQSKIQELVAKAKAEKTDWEEVIRTFNARFSHLPFEIQIQNREDVILKNDVPTIEFIFKDGAEQKKYGREQKKELLNVLSTGERRALYVLNVIFNIEIQRKEGRDVIIIVDDIADSFDYKNKYAIIDYIKHTSNHEKFFMIILTHNFDFLRAIEGRDIVPTHQCLMAIRYDNHIKLEGFKNRTDIRNPFERWKKNLAEDENLIASIPFVRNVIEYTQGIKDNADYLALTSILHIKDGTQHLTVGSLKDIYTRTLPNTSFPTDKDKKNLLEFIFETADKCLDAPEGINLENKIVLSIAIRLKAEQFMLSEISDKTPITAHQTAELLNRYIKEFNNKLNALETLKRVVLITPENIHINSFMYEPILDMGDGELRQLYKDTKNLK